MKALIIEDTIIKNVVIVDELTEGFEEYVDGAEIGDSIIDGLLIKMQKKQEVPQSISPRQIRQQLTAIGLRQAVEEYVASSSDYNLKDWWEYSTSFDRNNEILISASSLLGLTDAQVDDLFIEASKL